MHSPARKVELRVSAVPEKKTAISNGFLGRYSFFFFIFGIFYSQKDVTHFSGTFARKLVKSLKFCKMGFNGMRERDREREREAGEGGKNPNRIINLRM